jgi:ribosomal RNA assembly protein
MPRKIEVQNSTKAKKAVPSIEEKLKVNIIFRKKIGSIKGKEFDEFLAEKILRAVDFGFSIEDAMRLVSEDFILDFMDIKSHTRRKNMKDVKGRVIGRKGKALSTIEKLTGAVMVVHDNTVGFIVHTDRLEQIVQALESLIGGSKHGNVFAYLEKQNAQQRKFDNGDLGLKNDFAEMDIGYSEEDLKELDDEDYDDYM